MRPFKEKKKLAGKVQILINFSENKFRQKKISREMKGKFKGELPVILFYFLIKYEFNGCKKRCLLVAIA